MAHEMTDSDRMYSVREAPWHMDLGTRVDVLDLAPETREERMRLAGHDFEVLEQPVFTEDGVEIPEFKICRHSKTGKVFHILRDSFGTVQNTFGHELFEALTVGARLDDGTGGTVKDGAFCYLSARLDEPIEVPGDTSPVFPYVVVTWAHDGSASVSARSTNVRPVCWNTISWGEAVAKKANTDYTFRHSRRVTDRIEKAKKIIAGVREDAAHFQELANELADMAISDQQREEFIQMFIPAPASDKVISNRVLDNINEARNQMRLIFDSSTVPEVHRNTGWGMFQAGLEYLDHLRGYRTEGTYLGRTLLRDEPLKAKLLPMIKELAAA